MQSNYRIENENLKKLLKKSVDIIKKFKINEAKCKTKIAIIGMACRFPGGCDTPEKYWDLIKSGIIVGKQYPANRSQETGIHLANPASYLDSIAQFDPLYFGISPKEAEDMDPQQRILLQLVHEAAEYAGYHAKNINKRTAIYIGSVGSDFNQILARHEYATQYSLTGTLASILSGRISFIMGYEGEAITIDTACSSSLVALSTACEALQGKRCDTAFVGAANLILDEHLFSELHHIKALSQDGSCKTLSAEADGYGRGEGCAVVLLKRLDNALQDNDNILAVVESIQTNHDGRSSGLTVPNGLAQKKLIQNTVKDSDLKPEQIVYYEMHGTGTPLGDPIEFQAISEALRCNEHHRMEPLYVGSSKTNIGHLESCSGLAALIKAILMINNDCIPPHNFTDLNLNPRIKLSKSISFSSKIIPVNLENKAIAINAFGFSGTNACVIVSKHKNKNAILQNFIENECLFCLSAKNINSLQNYISKYLEMIKNHKIKDFGAFCYSTNISRSYDRYKIVFSVNSVEDLRKKLEEVTNDFSHIIEAKTKTYFGINDNLLLIIIEQMNYLKQKFPEYYEHARNSLSKFDINQQSEFIQNYCLAILLFVNILQSFCEDIQICYQGLVCVLGMYLNNKKGKINISEEVLSLNSFKDFNEDVLNRILSDTNAINNFYSLKDSIKKIEEVCIFIPKGQSTFMFPQFFGDLIHLGFNINWHNYYKGFSYIKVPVPTYPFSKEIYWPKHKIKKNHSKIVSKIEKINIPSDEEYYDVTNVILKNNNLKDTHYIVHIGIYVEILSHIYKEHIPLVIENLSFRYPLLIKQSKYKNIIVKLNSLQQKNEWIFLSHSNANTAWTEHVRGSARLATVFNNNFHKISELGDEISGEKFYYFMKKELELELGKSVKNIISIKIISDDQYTAKIKNEKRINNKNKMPFSIETLDCCAQLFHMNSYIRRKNDKYMVAGIDSLTLYQNEQISEIITCDLIIKSSDNENIFGDFFIFTEENRVLAEAKNFHMKRTKVNITEISTLLMPKKSYSIESIENFHSYVLDIIGEILGIIDRNLLEGNKPIQDFGMDSISAIHLKSSLDPFLSVELDLASVFNGLTINNILSKFKANNSSSNNSLRIQPFHSATVSVDMEKWIRNINIPSTAEVVLYGIPYGGAGISIFNDFSHKLPSHIHFSPIQLPGREDRINEKLLLSIHEIEEFLVPLIQKHSNLPFIIYGHSFGALIAASIMKKFGFLERASGIVLSACSSPNREINPWLNKINLSLINKFNLNFQDIRKKYDSIVQEDLHFLVKLLKLDSLNLVSKNSYNDLIKILLSDLSVVESFKFQDNLLVKPTLLLHGIHDDRVSEDEMIAWEKISVLKPLFKKYDSDHFFIRDSKIIHLIVHDIVNFSKIFTGGV